MNNSVAQLDVKAPVSGSAGRTAGTNVTLDGKSDTKVTGSSEIEASFDASMKQVAEDLQADSGGNNSASSGNALPATSDSMEEMAEDGPDMLLASVDSVEQSNELVQLTTKSQLSDINNDVIGVGVEADSDSALLMPQVGEQVQHELNESAVNAQAKDIAHNGSNAGVENAIDKSLIRQQALTQSMAQVNAQQTGLPGENHALLMDKNMMKQQTVAQSTAQVNAQQSEVSSIKNSPILDNMHIQQNMAQMTAEQTDLLGNKNQLLNMGAQHQLISDSQTSLLLRSGLAQAETSPGILPVALTASMTTVSPMALSPLPQAEITEPFGRPAWSEGMGKQIQWMVNQNISRAEIRLNPANLGPIEVRIDMSDDQINMAINSRHAVVREAMEMALPKLREMLDADGLNLAEADISQHSFAQQREFESAGNGSAFGNGEAENGTGDLELEAGELNGTAAMHLTEGNLDSMVDYYI